MFRRRGSNAVETMLDSDEKIGGKGRPTPKRSEAQAARKQRMKPPRTRKEASAIRKQRIAKQRGEMRQAMQTGEERYLPARDRGPVRRLARDFVDSRRTVGEYLLPIIAVSIILSLTHNAVAVYLSQIILLGAAAAAILTSWLLVRQFKRLARKRYPDERMKGVGMYVVMRAWQLRRLRMPKPQVKPRTSI
jgi:Flp pilus assembly protein TadB